MVKILQLPFRSFYHKKGLETLAIVSFLGFILVWVVSKKVFWIVGVIVVSNKLVFHALLLTDDHTLRLMLKSK